VCAVEAPPRTLNLEAQLVGLVCVCLPRGPPASLVYAARPAAARKPLRHALQLCRHLSGVGADDGIQAVAVTAAFADGLE